MERSLFLLTCTLVIVAGCGDGSAPLDGGQDVRPPDGGLVDTATDARSVDTSETLDADLDAPTIDAPTIDAPTTDAPVDASVDVSCNGVCEASDAACPSDCAVCLPGTVVGCYGGPPATSGVGLCADGTRVCALDGASFGPCEGEVLPRSEDCMTPMDEDCDGATPACPGLVLGVSGFGGSSDEAALCVDVANGRIAVGGVLRSATDFGAGPIVAGGSEDAFVAVLASDGTLLWARAFGNASAQRVTDVALLPDGGVVVLGQFVGGIDLGGGSLTGAGLADVFVARFDASGVHQWSHAYGDSGIQVPGAIAVSATGLVITGTFAGSMAFGGPLLTSGDAGDVFVASFDLAGAHVWSRRVGAAAFERGLDVALDADANVYVVGQYNGVTDLGGGPETGGGGFDAYIFSLDASGAHRWSHVYRSVAEETLVSVAARPTGEVVIGGSFEGTLDLGLGPLMSAGGADGLLAMLTPDGTTLWARRFGDLAQQRVLAVDAGPTGTVYFASTFAGSVDLGTGLHASRGGDDVFIGALDGDGLTIFTRAHGGTGAEAATGVAADATTLAAVGSFTGTVDFGALLGSRGGIDAFLLRLTP